VTSINVCRYNFSNFTTGTVGVVFLAVLLAGIPGSKLGSYLTVRLGNNPVHSVLWCNVCFVTATALAAVVLKGPQDQHLTFVFGSLWGCCLGWQQPIHTAAFVPLMVKGQETELMGYYILAGQILSWMPPTLFTILNESGAPMSLGLGSLCLFFVIAAIFLILMGDYGRAVATVQTMTSHTATFEMISPHDEDVDDSTRQPLDQQQHQQQASTLEHTRTIGPWT